MLLRLLLLLPASWGGLLTQPWGYQLDLQESVTVQEGLCVLVPCKFFYPSISFGPRYLFWFQKGVNMNDDRLVATNKPRQKLQERAQGRFFLPRDPGPNDCSLTITDVSRRDSGMYFFRMEHYTRSYSYRNKMLSLKVTALTHRPHILIPGTLESGRPRNVTCSVPWACERSTPPIFSWTSAALSSLGPRTHLSLEINLTPRPQDHGTSITCQVHFPAVGVTVESTVQLNVTYAPRDVAISVFHGNGTEQPGQLQGSLGLFRRPKAGTLPVPTSELVWTSQEEGDPSFVHPITLSLSLSLRFLLPKAIKILQSTSSLPIPQGEALLLRCAADSNPPAELSWFRGPPAPNATPISSTEILELPRVGTAEEEEFTCQIQHLLGSRNVSLRLSMAHQHQFWADSLSGHRGHDGASSISEEGQELHYAFLRFHKPKPQHQEGTNTEYSEIKVHK
ncbi:Sialic acid-binding Ig-like lectin 6 [Pteropus alecto]|uniref:Sialic acid-binding Ig-like lectin 6 n=1 Tax=Pteropus alecto TaxID=9402 RepID=L5L613_PTEAL|nr:Sialic acid-binding Ig-like lectin 6 [Pteropus alecto]